MVGQLYNITLQCTQVVVRHEHLASSPGKVPQEHHIGSIQAYHVGHAAVIHKVTVGLIRLVQHLYLGRARVNDLPGHNVTVKRVLRHKGKCSLEVGNHVGNLRILLRVPAVLVEGIVNPVNGYLTIVLVKYIGKGSCVV